MFWLIFLLPLQKVKTWTLMISLYLNDWSYFASQLRYSWTSIWREENPQRTPPPPSPTIQVWFCLLSKYLSLSMILNLVLFPFALSGAAFTSNSQETQGGVSIDTCTILELAHEYILYISNNHPSACRPCIIWITWPAKHWNSDLFILTPRPCWF